MTAHDLPDPSSGTVAADLPAATGSSPGAPVNWGRGSGASGKVKFTGIPHECEDGDCDACLERECFCPCHEEEDTGTVGGGGYGNGPQRGAQGRTWTVELPAGLQIVTLNDRHHWRTRYRLGQVIKDAAIIMTRQARIPPLGRVTITAVYQPPDRRHRDPDNISLAAKAAIDGITKAGVLASDDSRYVASVTCVIGEPYQRGRLILHITEVASAAAAGAA